MNQPVKRLDGSLLNGNHIKVEPSEDKTWPDLVASKQDSRLEVRRRLLNLGKEQCELLKSQPYCIWGVSALSKM